MTGEGTTVRTETGGTALERGLERTRREEFRMVEDVNHVRVTRNREKRRTGYELMDRRVSPHGSVIGVGICTDLR